MMRKARLGLQSIEREAERLRTLLITGYPKRATIWHDESIVVSGNAIIKSLRTSQLYNIYSYQDTAADGDTFTQSFILQEGNYTLYVLGATANDRGIIDWYIDDVLVINDQDWYSVAGTYNVVKSGSVTINDNGYHVLKGIVNGKNASSSNYQISLTKIWFVPTSD